MFPSLNHRETLNVSSTFISDINTHFTFFVERFNLCHNPIPFIILLVLIYTLLILILFQFPQSMANCSLILPAKHLPSYFFFYKQQSYSWLIIRMTHNIIYSILIHIKLTNKSWFKITRLQLNNNIATQFQMIK